MSAPDLPPIPNPRHPPGAALGGAAKHGSRPAIFDPDKPGLSDSMRRVIAFAATVRPDCLLASAPTAEAMLFLHNVTGLGDIELLLNRHHCVKGVRARGHFGRERVFIEMQLDDAR